MVEIHKNLKIGDAGIKMLLMHQEACEGIDKFFILSLSEENSDINLTKSISLEEAKQVVAYLNAHIIMAEK